MPDSTPPLVLSLTGTSNVRDLGGYVTADGRRVRTGRVLRGASIAGLTAADAQVLREAGVRTVCDLRGVEEKRREPPPVERLPSVVFREHPIEPRVGASLRDLIRTRAATGADTMAVMREAYVAYARDWWPAYAALFRLVGDGASHAVLFHCAAGKDRTGFGAALLLTALGVGWDDVMADYLATNTLWRADEELAARLPAGVASVLLRVHPELLEAAFGTIREAFGTVDAYLAARFGLDGPGLGRLRDTLLD